MSNINESLQQLLELDGAKAASLVDSESGMVLGEAGSGLDMELAAAGNSQVVKAKLDTIKNLELNEELVDIMITLDSQYHLIRPIKSQKGLFFYLVLDISKSNLALARRKVQNVETALEV
ncbi:hypothetical protein [Marinicella gelatinilytica]|uniref:hypothetical protein n=1 Tax=Marinicella gelatinilytica TaxID=2996017 RepID=UPI002260BD6C|nr:hypothetical protein [Marinicella gelatinilytica]MCX7545137.1 hypothetical protein [Marinicella gelatinilytica]